MLPFSIIKQVTKKNTPEPLVWHSRHYLQVHGVPIIQPKLRVIVEGKTQPIRTSFAGRDSFVPTEDQAGHHVLDMSKQPVKGFRVGEQPPKVKEVHEQSGMIPDRSEEGEEKGVEAKEGDEVKEEEEEVVEYEIRDSGKVEMAQRENNSFTGNLVNNFGNEVRTDQNVEKGRKLDLPEVFLERKEYFIQEEGPPRQRRELGRFQRDKNWTYQVILTKKEQQLLLRREEEWDRPPLIDNSSSQQLIRTIHPVEEEHVRDKMVEWEREHFDNRLSPSRMSRSSRRKKIFDGSIVQHEEVESEYLQQSERSQKEGEVRMEESQVQGYGDNLTPVNRVSDHGENEQLEIRDDKAYGSGPIDSSHLYVE